MPVGASRAFAQLLLLTPPCAAAAAAHHQSTMGVTLTGGLGHGACILALSDLAAGTLLAPVGESGRMRPRPSDRFFPLPLLLRWGGERS